MARACLPLELSSREDEIGSRRGGAVDPEAKVMFTKHAWTPPWLKVMAVGVTVPPGLALTRKSPAALTTAPATATLAGVKNGTAAKVLVELSE